MVLHDVFSINRIYLCIEQSHNMQVMSKIGPVNLLHIIDAETLTLSYPRESALERNLVVQLIDAYGVEVKVPIEIRDVTENSIEISIKNKPTGIFYLKIQDGISHIIKKIILQ